MPAADCGSASISRMRVRNGRSSTAASAMGAICTGTLYWSRKIILSAGAASSVQKTRPPAEREGAGSGTRVLCPPPDDGAVGAYEQTASTELARLVGGKGGRSAALARRCDNLDIGMADRIQAGPMDDGVRAPVAYHR